MSINNFLQDVRVLMRNALATTSLGFLAEESKSLLASGKMLRSRLAYRLGIPLDTPYKTLKHAAAAIELIHTASLLHDDVIDGGILRRGAPAFWVERGVSGSILLGDLLLFKGLELVCEIDNGFLVQRLIEFTGEVCEAESEQELVLQGTTSNLNACMNIARRKTGALFAFIALAAAGKNKATHDVLIEAGYVIGTAYQLADDLQDAAGDPATSDKTLGTDQRRDIISAATLFKANGGDPVAALQKLCFEAEHSLMAFPVAQKGMKDFIELDIGPLLETLISTPFGSCSIG